MSDQPTTLNISVKASRIDDLLRTTFAAGYSNYWANVVLTKRAPNIAAGAFDIEHATRGGELTVYDAECDNPDDPSVLGTINMERLKKGLDLMAAGHAEMLGLFLNDDEDAEVGDIFLQYVTMGEVRFGIDATG